MESNNIKIYLTDNEALVLYDFLTRFNEKSKFCFEDQAEQRVLWNLESKLENFLIAPFSEEYSNRLVNARDAIRDK
jgi:hypothetical protein